MTTRTTPGANRYGIGFRIVDLQPSLFGDLDQDRSVSASDIDLLSEEVRLMLFDELFDLNDDGAVDELDRTFWVEDIADTRFGDADLNGTVDFADFLNLSNSFNLDTGWANGDFSGDGTVNFADFLLLSVNYEGNGQAAAVPEPSSLALFGLALFGLGALRKRRAA